mgnify:CR=1 FL=1
MLPAVWKPSWQAFTCGEPCSVGWKEIRAAASHYFRIEESVAADGVRVLSSPLENDPRVLSGESGAAGFGTAFELLFHKAQYQEEISSLGLNSESVLCFCNTEGVTDRKNFLKIVWEGAFAEKFNAKSLGVFSDNTILHK